MKLAQQSSGTSLSLSSPLEIVCLCGTVLETLFWHGAALEIVYLCGTTLESHIQQEPLQVDLTSLDSLCGPSLVCGQHEVWQQLHPLPKSAVI